MNCVAGWLQLASVLPEGLLLALVFGLLLRLNSRNPPD